LLSSTFPMLLPSNGSVMGLGQTFLTRVGSGFFAAWVRSATSGFGKFPLKILIFFYFFPLKVKKYRCQKRVGPIFTGGQKYARVVLNCLLCLERPHFSSVNIKSLILYSHLIIVLKIVLKYLRSWKSLQNYEKSLKYYQLEN